MKFLSFFNLYFGESNYCVRFEVKCHVNAEADEDIYTADWFDCIYPKTKEQREKDSSVFLLFVRIFVKKRFRWRLNEKEKKDFLTMAYSRNFVSRWIVAAHVDVIFDENETSTILRAIDKIRYAERKLLKLVSNHRQKKRRNVFHSTRW